ncbi:MAG: FAD-dependent oxidoreductase [Gemmatimonadaceae bacterium]
MAERLELPLLRRLVLIGAGRANLHVLRALSKPLVRGLEIVLIAPDRNHYSAAMYSGLVRGEYTTEMTRIDVAALAERAGARLVHSHVRLVAIGERAVHTNGGRVPFDVCSLDVEGESEGRALPGVEAHAPPLRQMSTLPQVRQWIEEHIADASERFDCVIVGAGTRGVETAFILQRMLSGTRHGGVVTLVDEAQTILADAPQCRDIARGALERAGVCFVLGMRVVEVRDDCVLLGSGASLPAKMVLWATGASAPDFITASELPHDARGHLLVDDGLRAIDGSPVWAAGDCAARPGAVDGHRDSTSAQARVLERALRAAVDAPSSAAVRQGARELCLLDTGDGRALMRWGDVRSHSRLAGWFKRRLDRQFVAGFAHP